MNGHPQGEQASDHAATFSADRPTVGNDCSSSGRNKVILASLKLKEVPEIG
jgi:hypothetical protein